MEPLPPEEGCLYSLLRIFAGVMVMIAALAFML